MRRTLLCCLVLLIADVQIAEAGGQGYPSGAGGMGSVTGNGGRGPQTDAIPAAPLEVKPEKLAAKAYAAANKTMLKAHELERTVANTTDPNKKSRAIEKLDDAYGKALEQYTEVLRNKNDMADAWSQVGYIHLHFGAFRESVDDYNHALALQPDLLVAIKYRGEAYLGIDHLDEAKAAYMDLFFHARPMADQLMVSMQGWLQSRRSTPNGVRPGEIDAFDQWLQERDGIAKTTASSN
jgi:tetratricopeptide (TPR) repeat protein